MHFDNHKNDLTNRYQAAIPPLGLQTIEGGGRSVGFKYNLTAKKHLNLKMCVSSFELFFVMSLFVCLHEL